MNMRNWSRRSIVATIALVMGMTVALPASAITDGTVDGGDEFPFVAIAIQFTPDGAFFCSAGAIDEYHLVTAAHCFQDFVPPEFGGPANAPVPGIQIRYGVDAFAPDVVVTGTWYPDDWCPACGNGLPGFDSKDLAIIKLDTPVPLPEYVSLPTEGFSDTLRNKTSVMQAGYGVNDFIPGGGPLAGNAAFDGLRRFAPADLITSNHPHSDEYLKVSSNPSQGKGGTCFGDSGSPLMYDNGDTWVMLAATSYGTNGVCAGVGYFNRVDTSDALGFIDGIRNL
jgi:secreted trypsin-like serine protease